MYSLNEYITKYSAPESSEGYEPGSANGWLTRLANKDQFMEVEFGDTVEIRRLKLQGLKLGNFEAFVKTFQILYKTEEDKGWVVYRFQNNKDVS